MATASARTSSSSSTTRTEAAGRFMTRSLSLPPSARQSLLKNDEVNFPGGRRFVPAEASLLRDGVRVLLAPQRIVAQEPEGRLREGGFPAHDEAGRVVVHPLAHAGDVLDDGGHAHRLCFRRGEAKRLPFIAAVKKDAGLRQFARELRLSDRAAQ